MTHLSDFSYLERVSQNVLIAAYILYVIWTVDNFQSFEWRKLKKMEHKTIIAIFVLLDIVFFVVYDFIAVDFKYREGFYSNPKTGKIQTKPAARYSEHDKFLADEVCGPLINLSFSLQSSATFLLMAYYQEIIKKSMLMCKMPIQSFMSSTEHKIYTVYSAVSFSLYFILGKIFSGSEILRVVCPQLLFHFENLLCISLIAWINIRISLLTKNISDGGGPTYRKFEARLSAVRRQNTLLGACIAMEMFGLGLINMDILFWKFGGFLPVFYENKYRTDVLTCMFSLGISLHTLPIVNILFPQEKLNTGGARLATCDRSSVVGAGSIVTGSHVILVSTHTPVRRRSGTVDALLGDKTS